MAPLRDAVQELRELGLRGTLFRVRWELSTRSGLAARTRPPAAAPPSARSGAWITRLPFADPEAVADACRDRVTAERLDALHATAAQAIDGTILAFSRHRYAYGDPPDWHLNPTNGERWDATAPWSRALADQARVGDVKLTWEIGRFPHAYHLARAAAFHPAEARTFADALARQIRFFVDQNPLGRGVHWNSGQEIAFRLLAWLFATDTLLTREADGPVARAVAEALLTGAAHVEAHIDYARFAVYNNHLLSEALLLYVAGSLLPDAEAAPRWRRIGRELLEEQADRQFYPDGGYIQQSHTYHRVALQDLAWGCAFARAAGDPIAPSWTAAMARSLDFLLAHQNPTDGRLPNYGANDGALPFVLDTCDYTDFRPILQLVSALCHGERVYEPGPWDEPTAWFLGPAALDLPLRPPARKSVSFAESGHHVLRGRASGSFGALRCGSLRDRFSQIDMLHLDVWWRGQNVLVDAGTYLYNGDARWHEHFLRTGSHNTVALDGRDQMLHFRKFKVLYLTKARLLSFRDEADHATATGEHLGYARHPGGCVHRRSVLFAKHDLWVVLDTITGEGEHEARLHWLGGELPWTFEPAEARLALDTPEGTFDVAVYDTDGRPLPGTCVAGEQDPPRGWLSRYYAEKVAAPSLVVHARGPMPLGFVSLLGAGRPRLIRDGGAFGVEREGAPTVRFRIHERALALVRSAP